MKSPEVKKICFSSFQEETSSSLGFSTNWPEFGVKTVSKMCFVYCYLTWMFDPRWFCTARVKHPSEVPINNVCAEVRLKCSFLIHQLKAESFKFQCNTQTFKTVTLNHPLYWCFFLFLSKIPLNINKKYIIMHLLDVHLSQSLLCGRRFQTFDTYDSVRTNRIVWHHI